jgi:L-alanine-DL-glutamate epimerase-like enolase superfamily enzyme
VKIVDARAIICSPGRNFVTLKLTTDEGLTGVGDATLNGRELAVAGYLDDHVCPTLIGRDANRIEDTPGDAPGLGVDIDEEIAERHPDERAYLPVNRTLDGTVHPW